MSSNRPAAFSSLRMGGKKHAPTYGLSPYLATTRFFSCGGTLMLTSFWFLQRWSAKRSKMASLAKPEICNTHNARLLEMAPSVLSFRPSCPLQERMLPSNAFCKTRDSRLVGDVFSSLQTMAYWYEWQNRELQIMRIVRHPNIVELKAFYYSNGERVSLFHPAHTYWTLLMTIP